MRPLVLFATIAVAGLPVLAEEAAPTAGVIDADFTWSATNLATIPAADGGTTSVLQARLVLTSNIGGPIDKLAGSCLLEGLSQGQDWHASGSCALEDADGDLLFEDIKETGEKGEGTFVGGTGKFAGVTGEHTYTTTWFSSLHPGENQGTGVKKGHWGRTSM